VLDLPASERGSLEEAVARQAVAAVIHRAGSIEVLPRCRVPGSYHFQKRSETNTYTARGDADLRHYFPLRGTRFRPALAANHIVTVDTTEGGDFVARDYLAERTALSGSCDGATHVLRRLVVGAFTVRSSDELLDAAGDPKACRDDDQQRCRIALKAFLAPLR
jgi:hypothetical protein